MHRHLRFDYQQARSDRTALNAFNERVGVCRDFTHLAITLCRRLNIPCAICDGLSGETLARRPYPIQWILVLGLRFILVGDGTSSDYHCNQRRIGRIVIGRGRDAADVPVITTFGPHRLEKFEVVTNEISIQEQSYSEVGGGEMAEAADEPWVADKVISLPHS